MSTPIPDALRSAVLARLAQMNRAERSVIMRAAAVGRHFDVSVVAEVAASTETNVHGIMERARDLQIVVPSGPGRYSFRHALTRQIVYAESFNGPARALHRRIVRALEKAGRRDEAALADLAYHAWAAGDPRRTLRYNEIAGDHAAGVHATDDAQTYYTRARSSTGIGSNAYARLTEKLQALGGER